MMLYRLSRWRPLRRNFTSGFRSGNVALFRMLVSISKPIFFSYNSIRSSGLEKQKSTLLKFYFRFRFRPYHRSQHVILHQSAKCRSLRTVHGRKMTPCRFSRCRISAILNFRGPIMGSLKSPYRTSHR